MGSMVGKILEGRYAIESLLRSGGMASIYVATQSDSPNLVAVKVLLPSLSGDPIFIRRFRREIEAVRRFDHPQIVRTIGAGEQDGQHYFVMELVDGENLAALLRREGRVAEPKALEIILQVVSALAHAHERGVIHRDLKPENIMIERHPGPEVRVKVVDFGIARVEPQANNSETTGNTRLTKAGTILGTPAYVSPEQGGAEPIDHRHDIYATGVLLYELLTGKPPFHGGPALQVVMRHVNEAPRPPSEFMDVSPALERILLKTLAKKPSERQPSARALEDDLRGLTQPERSEPEDAKTTEIRLSTSPPLQPQATLVLPAPIDATNQTRSEERRRNAGPTLSAPTFGEPPRRSLHDEAPALHETNLQTSEPSAALLQAKELNRMATVAALTLGVVVTVLIVLLVVAASR